MGRMTLMLTDASKQPAWHFGMEACPECGARWLDRCGLIVRVHVGDNPLLEYPVAVMARGRIDDVVGYIDWMLRETAGIGVRIACMDCGLDVLGDPRIAREAARALSPGGEP